MKRDGQNMKPKSLQNKRMPISSGPQLGMYNHTRFRLIREWILWLKKDEVVDQDPHVCLRQQVPPEMRKHQVLSRTYCAKVRTIITCFASLLFSCSSGPDQTRGHCWRRADG